MGGEPFDTSDFRCLLSWELVEQREAGFDVTGLEDAVVRALTAKDPEMCSRLLEALGHCPRLAAWP